MQVFLTGGTGFVGGYVLRALLERGHAVRCLTRSRSLPTARWELDTDRVETVRGDVTDAATLEGALAGCDAAVHLVGILEERPRRGVTFDAVHYRGTVNVVDAARRAGVEAFVHMSANGADPDGVSEYHVSKARAEECVRSAGFDRWTIFRPSIVFGDPGPGNPEFASRLAETLVRPFPVLPVFGDGRYELQPIDVEALAAAFAQALTVPEARGCTYCAAGRDRITFDRALDVVARGMGLEPRPKIHVPLWLGRPVVETLGRTGLIPVTPDQLAMLLRGNTCDSTAFFEDFDVSAHRFEPEALTYLRAHAS